MPPSMELRTRKWQEVNKERDVRERLIAKNRESVEGDLLQKLATRQPETWMTDSASATRGERPLRRSDFVTV